VETALLKAHVDDRYTNSKKHLEDIEAAAEQVTPELVYEEEHRTHHNIRALVNVFKQFLPDELKPLVHLGATSVDILDTSAALRIRDAVRMAILPILIDLETSLAGLAEREADTPQIGRTHGQHAVPITFGFALSEYVSRLGKSIIGLEKLSAELRGKLSGAVGAYNALSLICDDPAAFERSFLDKLGLNPSEHSTQLVEPEYVLRLLLEINVAFGIIANLADDLRNLQRSEISEVREVFGKDQVGSSTMPQKRNPWNSEHVKSMWKALAPRVVTFYADQISEHQRDLTNSASSRFTADFLVGFADAVARMNQVIESIVVDRARMKENLKITSDFALSEAAYVLLAAEGVPDAHEEIRKATLECEESGASLSDLLRQKSDLWDKISRRLEATVGIQSDRFFEDPSSYSGKAAEVTRRITKKYKSEMKRIMEVLA